VRAASRSLALLGAAALLAAPGRAGEPAAAEPPQVDDARLRELPAATVRAGLVAVVKVSAVAAVKAGAGEDPAAAYARSMFQGEPVVREVSAGIEEVLKGDKDAKAMKAVTFRVVTAKVKIGKGPFTEIVVVKDWYAGGDYGLRRARALVSARFTMAPDRKYLVFLAPFEHKDAAGKAVERGWALADPPVEGAPEPAVAAVKGTLQQIADWEKPPKLAPEAEAAVQRLIAGLGSTDFKAREAASQALIAKGPAIRPYLEAARASPDPEVRQRAETVLGEVKPAVLRNRAPQPEEAD
jgi:hypothetical protein